MTDRRAKTSRANLGEHIPEALGPDGSVVVTVRIPRALLHKIDNCFAPGALTRSEAMRELLWQGLARLDEYH